MKNKSKVILFCIVVLAIGSYWFIKDSNNHKECSTVKEYSTDKNGNQVATEKHICKEKYNF
jgi:hypothetical protein